MIVDFGPILISTTISSQRSGFRLKFNLISIKIDWFWTFFDKKIEKDRLNVIYLIKFFSNLNKNVKFTSKFQSLTIYDQIQYIFDQIQIPDQVLSKSGGWNRIKKVN